MVKAKVLEGAPMERVADDNAPDPVTVGVQVANPEGGVFEVGDEIDLDEAEARVLVAQGAVEDVEGVLEPAEAEAEAEVEVEVPTAEEVGIERPAVADNKDAWSDYVEALGGDPAGKTKNELIDLADELEAGGE